MANQTQEELNNHLKEQLEFLKLSADSFDGGFEGEAKRLAVTIRVLLYDSSSCISLLNQLGLKSKKFYDTSFKPKGVVLGPYEGIVMKMMSSDGAKYVAPLDDFPEMPAELLEKERGIYIDFDTWWAAPILTDNQSNQFNRKDLILDLTNKDGGAHIDPNITGKYESLSRKNSMGWMGNNGVMGGPEKAAVRQIAHEVLKSIVDNYPIQKKLNQQKGPIIDMVWFVPKNKK